MKCAYLVSGECRAAWRLPVSVSPVGNDALATLIIGSVIIYLFREPETVVAPPVGVLVVVEQEESAHPPVLTGVSDEPDLQPLTPRELEVLRLLALGWENEYIAAELEVTLHMVRSHVANLRWKLNAKSRFQAVIMAIRDR